MVLKQTSAIKQQIRVLLDEVSELSRPVSQLNDGDDLFDVGLTSFAAVSLMMAIEQEFSVSFPDQMLTRSTFANIDALDAAIMKLQNLDHAA